MKFYITWEVSCNQLSEKFLVLEWRREKIKKKCGEDWNGGNNSEFGHKSSDTNGSADGDFREARQVCRFLFTLFVFYGLLRAYKHWRQIAMCDKWDGKSQMTDCTQLIRVIFWEDKSRGSFQFSYFKISSSDVWWHCDYEM